MRRVAAVLIHYPILDRERSIVTTAITNLDLHDIARSAYTYGLSDFFVVHPIEAQRKLAERVRNHWTDGSGARRIPDRSKAMSILRVVPSLDDVLHELGGDPELWSTSAQAGPKTLEFRAARERLQQGTSPVLIAFGTGWGLAEAVTQRAAHQLEPIQSPRADGYNHLSVRAAAAITFDRLLAMA